MAENWNNDSNKAPKDVDAIKKTDPRGDQTDKGRVAHQALETADEKKESGIDIGIVNAPVQSVHPTSGTQGVMGDDEEDKPEFKMIGQIKTNDDDFKYPFKDLKAGDAMFVPVEKGSTTDKLMAELRKMTHDFREKGAEVETDENGDQVRESVVIETRKRTDDGLIQLDGSGKPIVGANQTNRYKLIYSCNFTVKAIVKGDDMGNGKANKDGVLVTRVF